MKISSKAMMQEIVWQALIRALLAASPCIILLLVTHDKAWLTAALIAVCATIVEERAGLAPLGIVLHGTAIAIGFVMFVAALSVPSFFVLMCMIMAVATICLTIWGRKLRSLGNFTFIPALYIACETFEKGTSSQTLNQITSVLPYIFYGIVPVVILATVWPVTHEETQPWKLWRLSHKIDFGEPLQIAETAVAIAIAVGLAACLVEWRMIDHGQWVIWSSASVITSEATSSPHKLRDRTLGALVGVPLGIGAGFIVPHTFTAYSISILAAFITLVTFKRYIISFATRCALIALALVVANQTPEIAAERLVNVILGGVIGVLCVLVINWISQRMGSKKHKEKP